MLEEIHAIRELKPQVVTKSALGGDTTFEKVCKKPGSTATERAIARLAMHALLNKKIDELKAVVKAFKDARQNDAEVKSSKKASEENHSMDALCSKGGTMKLQHEGIHTIEQKDKETKILAKKPINNSKEKIVKMEHRAKAVDITNSPSKTSEKDSVIPSKPQKTPADPEIKALNQTKKEKVSDSSLGGNSAGQELH